MACCVISLHLFISAPHQTSCSSKKALLFSAKHAVHFKLYISDTKKIEENKKHDSYPIINGLLED